MAMVDPKASMDFPPRSENPREDKEMVKNAVKNAEHIGRKVKTLDTVVTGIKSRYKDAQDNLYTLRVEMDHQQKNLDFAKKQRDKLQDRLNTNKAKVKALREGLEEARQKQTDNLNRMTSTAKMALTGTKEQPGLRKISSKLISQDLEIARGYSCAMGTTPGRDGLARTMMPYSS
mmetsp:Transcript_68743/g.119433  ORF Transcript_68743/g.119433 Transcript_68743/m.119433 type:complete len:175 (+) Transcript_68743:132-656(+)